MNTLSRWFAPVALAAAVGFGATLVPAPAQAQDDALVRVLVDIADVVLRSGVPYYRYGDYGYNDRLVAGRDRYGRVIYYRYVPRAIYRHGPPYGNAYGHYRNAGRVKCNKHGKCHVKYYDARYDRDRWTDRVRWPRGRWDRDHDHGDHDGRWNDRRWHDDD